MTDLRRRCNSSIPSLSQYNFTMGETRDLPPPLFFFSLTYSVAAFAMDKKLDRASGLVSVLTVINKGLLLSLFSNRLSVVSQIKCLLFQGYQNCRLFFRCKVRESCDTSLRASQTDTPKVILTCCQACLSPLRPSRL